MALYAVPRHHVGPVRHVPAAFRARRVSEAGVLRLDVAPQSRELDGRRAALPLATDPDLVAIRAVPLGPPDRARPRGRCPILIGIVVLELVAVILENCHGVVFMGVDGPLGRGFSIHVLLHLVPSRRHLHIVRAAQRLMDTLYMAPELPPVRDALPAPAPLAHDRARRTGHARSLLQARPLLRNQSVPQSDLPLRLNESPVGLPVARRGGARC